MDSMLGSIDTETPAPAFALKDSPIENQRPLKVRVIGAGYSGIYLGIRIPQRLRNIDLQIYEKNENIGGTWWENRYPGCACDIPSHSYQYSFEPNPKWSHFYSPAQEICAYLHSVADKYGVNRFVKLSHRVTVCKWDESVKKWNITIENVKTGEVVKDDADILITARGTLNDIAWPKIPGFETFKGEVMHSAAWNDEYDFKSKRVGIIGGGSSSIQIVPQLQKIEGAELSCFVRSKTWITNPFGDNAMKSLGLDPQQLSFTEAQKAEFANNPAAYHTFRKAIEVDGNLIHGLSLLDHPIQKAALSAFPSLMRTRLSSAPEIAESLIPTFSVGCRRLTPGPGYLEALASPNVDFISTPITAITATSVVLSTGRDIPIDALVCATGFNASAAPPFAIYGRDGISIEERFSPYPKTYLSIALAGFPNAFMMLGPNSLVGTGSLTMCIETQGDYITKCIRKLQKEDYATMSVKAACVDEFSEIVGEYFKRTVYMDECNSWYRSDGGKGDRIAALWPGSTLHFIEAMRAPRWEDWEFESLGGSRNRFGWFGNGWSVTQLGQGDPAFYLEEGVLDVPREGRPEEEQESVGRPWSH